MLLFFGLLSVSAVGQGTATDGETTTEVVMYPADNLPTVTSNKADYSPGMTAIITGTGWVHDSLVDVHFEEEPAQDHHHGYHDTEVDSLGNWRIEYPIEIRHIGVKFTVIVDGIETGYQGITHFTDANVKVFIDEGNCYASVNFGEENNVNILGSAPTVVYKINGTEISSPYDFPVGNTIVDVFASNLCGEDNDSFTVTVEDTTPPVVDAVSAITVTLDDSGAGSLSLANVLSQCQHRCLWYCQ